jgi:hypothetical protein
MSNSRPILSLVDIVKPDTDSCSLVEDGDGAKLKRNTNYMLSIVRKFGETVYASPETLSITARQWS